MKHPILILLPMVIASTAVSTGAGAQSNQALNFAEMLRGEGYTDVEVEAVRGATRVEGVLNGTERTVVFDDESGAVVADRVNPIGREGLRGEAAASETNTDVSAASS